MDSKKETATYLIKKHGRARVLQIFYYTLGLPLFCLLVYIGSVSFIGRDAFASTQYYGLLAALAIWAVLIIVNLIAALICRRQFIGRAVIMVIFTLIVMIGGSVFFDVWMEKKINGYRDEYARLVYEIDEEEPIYHDGQLMYLQVENGQDEEGNPIYQKEYLNTIYKDIDIPTYKKQIANYVPWSSVSGYTKKFNNTVDTFSRIYNVSWESSVKGKENTDGTPYVYALERTVYDEEAGEDVTYQESWFGETGKVYKQNGLYGDGYIFSVKVANNILIRYNEIQREYKRQGKDVDALTDAALVAASTSSEYINYKSSDEYVAAQNAGTLDKYCITTSRLNDIIHALGIGIKDELIPLLQSSSIQKVLSMVGYSDLVNGIIEDVPWTNLTVSGLINVIKGIAGESFSFTEADILNLIGGYSNYEVSTVLPVMYFIKDETLREYAYARYYAKVHGANIGSILVAEKGGKIGCVTLSSSGYDADQFAFTLNQSYLLKVQSEYIPTFYPFFATRRYALIMGGIVAFLFVAMYHAKMRSYITRKKLEFLAGGTR
ncbi:MAG: hypothetical protein K5765_08835 [Clostridia bacterium]|nr:hypothetical protein [Clostridia bacterium]